MSYSTAHASNQSGFGSPGFSRSRADQSSVTTSAVSAGAIVVTEPAGPPVTAAALRTTTTTDAETAGTLHRAWDGAALLAQTQINVQVTATAGANARGVLAGYMAKNRDPLIEAARNAKTEDERDELRARIATLNAEERVLNLLIGAVTGTPGAALSQAALSQAAEMMRDSAIADSKKSKGATDKTTVLTNISGVSDGVQGDGYKIGGTRLDPDLLCGKDYTRCAVDPITHKLAPDSEGRIQFLKEQAGQSLEEFLKNSPDGQRMAGPTGGIQGSVGTLFGRPYAPGSWQDRLIEAFSGPHDTIGGKATGLYDDEGNIRKNMSEVERKIYDNLVTTAALVPAAPFALAALLPAQVWNAIAETLKVIHK